MSWQTWSPFQSPEVREICRNLTPEEKNRLLEASRETGTQIGRVAAPAAFLIVGVASAGLVAFGLPLSPMLWIAVVTAGMIVMTVAMLASPQLRASRRRNLELLCSTKYARSKGYTPQNIRLQTLRGCATADDGNQPPAHFTQSRKHG